MKDDLAITLKKIEEFFIELNQEGIIKKEHLQEILQKLKELKETVNELQDIFNKNFNLPELLIKLKEFEETYLAI
ncbi:MAG: hypothetical protein MUO82_06465 [Candidatus Thermoplasmatota archaeon]|nr:hypothetical protein [Candidatus Thermoplasmatota archaeon]